MAKKLDPMDIAAQQQAREQAEVEQAFLKGITTLRDLIAPSSIEIHNGHFRLGTKYGRTMYVYGYPREIYTGWLSSIINIDEVLDMEGETGAYVLYTNARIKAVLAKNDGIMQ